MPTTYVDELGVIIDEEKLKKYVYKTLNYTQNEETTNGFKKVYSIRQIKITGQQTEIDFSWNELRKWDLHRKKEDEKEYQLVMANYKLTNQKFESVEQANKYVKNKPIELIIAIWGVLTELNK